MCVSVCAHVCVLGCGRGCYANDSTSGGSWPVPVRLSSAGSDVTCLSSSPPDTGNGPEWDIGLSVCLSVKPSLSVLLSGAGDHHHVL